VDYFRTGEVTKEACGALFMHMLNDLERVAERAENIAFSLHY